MHALPRLRPRLATRGGFRRHALDVRPIRGGRPPGVLRGLVKALFQLCDFGFQRSTASFIAVDDHPHRDLHLGRESLPECGQQRELIGFHRTSLSSFLALLQVWDVKGHSSPCVTARPDPISPPVAISRRTPLPALFSTLLPVMLPPPLTFEHKIPSRELPKIWFLAITLFPQPVSQAIPKPPLLPTSLPHTVLLEVKVMNMPVPTFSITVLNSILKWLSKVRSRTIPVL